MRKAGNSDKQIMSMLSKEEKEDLEEEKFK